MANTNSSWQVHKHTRASSSVKSHLIIIHGTTISALHYRYDLIDMTLASATKRNQKAGHNRKFWICMILDRDSKLIAAAVRLNYLSSRAECTAQMHSRRFAAFSLHSMHRVPEPDFYRIEIWMNICVMIGNLLSNQFSLTVTRKSFSGIKLPETTRNCVGKRWHWAQMHFMVNKNFIRMDGKNAIYLKNGHKHWTAFSMQWYDRNGQWRKNDWTIKICHQSMEMYYQRRRKKLFRPISMQPLPNVTNPLAPIWNNFHELITTSTDSRCIFTNLSIRLAPNAADD